MAQFTGQLGDNDSELGSFELGSAGQSGTEHDESASSTLVLTQDVVDDYEWPRSASNALVLDHSVIAAFHETSSTLALTSSATLIIDVTAETVMLLAQIAVSSIKSESVESVLALTQNASNGGAINQNAFSTLALVDTAVAVGPVYVSAFNSLIVIQIDPATNLPVSSGETSPSGFTVNEGLRQEVAVHESIKNINIQHYISFSDKAAPTYEETVVQPLNLVQSIDRIYTTDSTLNLSQSVVVENTLGASDLLELIDVATFNLNSVQGPLSELSIQHALTFVLITGNVLCNYNPFVGDGALGNPPPPPMTPPTIP